MNLSKTLIIVFAIVFLASCGGTKNMTKSQQKSLGEEQYQVCSEEASDLQDLYFIGIGEGQSINSQMSQKMARAEARTALAEMMETFVVEDIKQSESQGTDPASYGADWESKVQQAVSKKLQGLSTFCSKTYKNDQGLYTSYIGIKLDTEKKVFMPQIKKELLSSY